jgi:GH15 family glucan-1,4-alpha-glucosidase
MMISENSLNLAVVGNCNIAALIDSRARVVWYCVPRFDGDPVFCSLLNNGDVEKGFWDIELFDFARSEQRYRPNSAVVITTLYDNQGGVVEITDFAPRFKQYGRIYRPMSLVRHIKPRKGAPRIRIRIRPAYDYGGARPETTRGSNHIRYVMPDLTLRVTTDGPVTYLLEEVPFVLDKPVTMLMGPDESLTQPVAEIGRAFHEKTDEYWREWCRYLSLPFEWQEAVIRAAITLKLCSFEESGGIVAAMTTSIPEAPGSGRNWDYRHCWLRDSFFVVNALNALGVTWTMEEYLSYITNIVAQAKDGYLQPVYGITLKQSLTEFQVESLAGYHAMGPVRIGNDAWRQVQNDGYGSVVLALSQSFYDHRLTSMGDNALFENLEKLGEQAVARWDKPDAGIWEFRSREAVHTYSSVFCWAACDRLAKIAVHLGLEGRESYWRQHADGIREGTLKMAWSDDLDSFTGTFGGSEMDGSLLLLPTLGFLRADDPRFLGTLKLAEERLRDGMYMHRYAAPDDFGMPETSFNVCTFWYIEALAAVGRVQEARELFENMLAHRNPLGLLSEDIDVKSGDLWGNFPQTYSMVGLIHAAMRLSRPWEEAL